MASQRIIDTPPTAAPQVLISGSEGFHDWLRQQQISLAFTTYQTNRLFLLGCKEDGRLAVNERLFDKPMGLFLDHDSLLMACRYQIWQLENRLGAEETHQGADRLYVPSVAYTTGDINAHDVVMTASRRLLFMNTDFSCLAALKPGYSFEPVWQPPFIKKLVAEDRCHLNGLALRQGQPAYVTACSTTDSAAGWRDQRVAGGVVLHVSSGEAACHAGPNNDQAVEDVPNGFALVDCEWHDFYGSFLMRIQVRPGAIPAQLAETA
jgi:uncharacterized protein (TIGR03032 family)